MRQKEPHVRQYARKMVACAIDLGEKLHGFHTDPCIAIPFYCITLVLHHPRIAWRYQPSSDGMRRYTERDIGSADRMTVGGIRQRIRGVKDVWRRLGNPPSYLGCLKLHSVDFPGRVKGNFKRYFDVFEYLFFIRKW